MATKFKYEARDATGKVVKGAVSATSQSMAVAEVRRRNLVPLDVKQSAGLGGLFKKPVGGKKALAKRLRSRRVS